MTLIYFDIDSVKIKCVELPTTTDLRDAIRSLDGKRICEVRIEKSDEAGFSVFGGLHSLFSCCVAENGFASCMVNEKSDSSKELVLVEGGLPEFPANLVVSLEAAMSAAEYYLIYGDISPNFAWDRPLPSKNVDSART